MSALKNKLKTLKGSDFDTAETKVNALEAQIKAVEKVNALFNKSAIVDGELNKEAQVKAAVSIPAVPKTENEKLNKVLAQAINLAKHSNQRLKLKKSKQRQLRKIMQLLNLAIKPQIKLQEHQLLLIHQMEQQEPQHNRKQIKIQHKVELHLPQL